MKSIILASLLAGIPFGAYAQVATYAEASDTGESLDQFALRIAPRAVAAANKDGVELCGAIETSSDGQHRIEMYVTESTVKCVIPRAAKAYFVALPFFVKPLRRPDLAIPGYQAHGKRVYFQDGDRARTVGSFSAK